MMRHRLWVAGPAAVLLLAASCTSLAETGVLQPIVATPPATTAPTTTAPTSTTIAAPTTSTTIAALVRFDLAIVPDPGTIELEPGDGRPVTVMTPFRGELEVPLVVRAVLDGFNPLTETLTAATDETVTLYLDPSGQLVHKLAEWSTGGAPKQVAFTPNGSQLWVTLLDGTGLEVYDATTGGLIEAVDLPDAGSVEVIFNRAGSLAYVSQMETASIFEIDVATRRVLRRLPAGGVWTKVMALSPDEQTLYASNWVSNDVGEIDLVTGEVRRRIPTVATPRGLYVTDDGSRLYVAGFGHGELQVIDLATGTGRIIYRSGGALRHLVGDATGGVLYADDMARATVLAVDLATDEVRVLATVDRTPNTMDLSPDGRVLFVSCRGRNNPETYYLPGPEWGTVVVIDTATGDYLDAVIAGNQTTGLDVSGNGTRLAFSDFLDDRVSLYEVPAYEVLEAGDGGRWPAHLDQIVK